MASEMRKSRVTEIQVRMDCNGCVQKIKKALHGISGIYELYVDLPQQKITIIGWADPQKIVKAIKKTRKTAIICSHTEPPDQPTDDDQPEESAPDQAGGAPPAPDSANPPPPDQTALPSEQPASPSEPPKQPASSSSSSPPPEAAKQSPAESTPVPDQAADAASSQQQQQHQHPGGEQQRKQKDVEEVHVIYHYPPDYGYRSYANNYGNNNVSHGYGGLGFRPDQPPPPPPMYATHSYSSHRTSPYVTQYEYIRSPEPTPPLQSTHRSPPPPYATATRYEYVRPEPTPPTPATPPLNSVHHSYSTHRPSPYVTQYEYVKPPSPPSPPPPPPPQQYGHYSRPVPYSEDYSYYNGNSYNNNGNITSVFSDENPNACTIV